MLELNQNISHHGRSILFSIFFMLHSILIVSSLNLPLLFSVWLINTMVAVGKFSVAGLEVLTMMA